MDRWSIAWVIWLAAFGAIEAKALWNKRAGDTLSENVWRWFAVIRTDHASRWRRFLLLTLIAWMAAHFLGGGRFV